MRRLQQLCQDREDVLDLIDRARQQGEVKGKRNDLVDNVNHVVKSPDGNSTEFALRRPAARLLRTRCTCWKCDNRLHSGSISPLAHTSGLGH